MIEYFKESDLLKVKKQRKLVLAIYFIVLGVYALFCAGMMIWYLRLPYQSPTITVVKIIHHSVGVIMMAFTLLYFGITFKRVNRFYHTAFHLINAMNDTSTGNFIEYDETLQDKDGVDFKSLVFLEWNKYKNEFFERKVLVFNEWEFPEIPENATVKYVTQSNILLRYEII